MITVHALVNKHHRKDVTTCQRRVAAAVGIGIPVLALAVSLTLEVLPAALVLQDLTGCPIMEVIVCLMLLQLTLLDQVVALLGPARQVTIG